MSLRTVIALATLGLAVLGSCGCNDDAPQPKPTTPGTATSTQAGKVDLTVAKLSKFSRFSVYWVGEEYAGSKLDRIIGQYPGAEDDPVLALYGACGTSFETGCTPDLVVKSWRGCLRSVDDGLKVRERTARRDGHLEVQAGDVVATIYAASPELEAAAAQEIVTANAGANPQILA